MVDAVKQVEATKVNEPQDGGGNQAIEQARNAVSTKEGTATVLESQQSKVAAPGSVGNFTLMDGNEVVAGAAPGAKSNEAPKAPGTESGTEAPQAAGAMSNEVPSAPATGVGTEAAQAPAAGTEAAQTPAAGTESSPAPKFDSYAEILKQVALTEQIEQVKDAQGNPSVPSFQEQQSLADQLQAEAVIASLHGFNQTGSDYSIDPSSNPNAAFGVEVDMSPTGATVSIGDRNGAEITRFTPIKDGVPGQTVSKDTPGKTPAPGKTEGSGDAGSGGGGDAGHRGGGRGNGGGYDGGNGGGGDSTSQTRVPVEIQTPTGVVPGYYDPSSNQIIGGGADNNGDANNNTYYGAPQ